MDSVENLVYVYQITILISFVYRFKNCVPTLMKANGTRYKNIENVML